MNAHESQGIETKEITDECPYNGLPLGTEKTAITLLGALTFFNAVAAGVSTYLTIKGMQHAVEAGSVNNAPACSSISAVFLSLTTAGLAAITIKGGIDLRKRIKAEAPKLS